MKKPMRMPSEWLPPIEDYIQSRRCPQCKADPWAGCTWGVSREPWEGQFHVRRVDGGAAHRQRDYFNAPWAEDCEPGQVLHSIKYPDGRVGAVVTPVFA